MQMTMSTPDDSDGEEDVPLSTRKRKNTSKLQKKRGRPSKRSEDYVEMTMSDGEEDVSLSTRKRKNTSKLQKKRGRPSKRSEDYAEILLDGEAVVEDLDEADG